VKLGGQTAHGCDCVAHWTPLALQVLTSTIELTPLQLLMHTTACARTPLPQVVEHAPSVPRLQANVSQHGNAGHGTGTSTHCVLHNVESTTIFWGVCMHVARRNTVVEATPHVALHAPCCSYVQV
jgi:hypothetical protein